MKKDEAIEWVKNHDDDDDMDQDELEEAFAAIFERPADDQDRVESLWSHLCAAVEDATGDEVNNG